MRSLPFKVNFVILLGSTVYSERLKDSDIDLIVVSKDFDGMPFKRGMPILQKSWKHDVMLEAFEFTPKEFEKLKDKSIVVKKTLKKGRKS
ncbi:MAG: nucleotidyltransferase domain-containing protein [Candidatus Bathyarchaeia archaeon]